LNDNFFNIDNTKENFIFSIAPFIFSTISQAPSKSKLLVCKYFDVGSIILNISKNKCAAKMILKLQSLSLSDAASENV